MLSFPSTLNSIDDLSNETILYLLDKALQIQHNPELFQLKNRPFVSTLFLENSTRTKNSFAISALKLNAHYIDINPETSSLKKGENFEETLLTLKAQGFELLIIRSSLNDQLSPFSINPPIKLINGGDGTREHPTQALLDLFTLSKTVGGLEHLKNKTISIHGDIFHSRVAKSLIKLLPQFGINIILTGPDEFLNNAENDFSKNITIEKDRSKAILQSDFIYLLRIQEERINKSDKSFSIRLKNYHENFGINLALLKSLNKKIPVFHPGPANIGIEIDDELIKSSLYLGHTQVQLSIPMRMAILHTMLKS